MEPITVAVTAFSAVKAGIKAGRELQDMAGDLGKLWGGLDTARASHNQKRTKAMRNEFVSVEEEALKTFAAKRKADEIEKELDVMANYDSKIEILVKFFSENVSKEILND